MKITGIICEYNPLHLGHKKQLDTIRALRGQDSAIVCLMSGNFVQRGEPAIFHKSLRARAALEAGADLVLELPVTYALRSAEGFAQGGVDILSAICDTLCFGAEDPGDALTAAAEALVSPEFTAHLRTYLDEGLSFPAARQRGLEDMGIPGDILTKPNNILAVEYCKAARGTQLQLLPIYRGGDYHDPQADADNPSATALRRLLLAGESIDDFTPCRQNGALHALDFGEKAVLARLRTMTEEEFALLPGGSEGLWRKFMHACRRETGISAILEATKSKRYTHTRIARMLLCAYLGITDTMLRQSAPYVRVLGMNATGQKILSATKKRVTYINASEKSPLPYYAFEQRCASLYALCAPTIDPMEAEDAQTLIRI